MLLIATATLALVGSAQLVSAALRTNGVAPASISHDTEAIIVAAAGGGKCDFSFDTASLGLLEDQADNVALGLSNAGIKSVEYRGFVGPVAPAVLMAEVAPAVAPVFDPIFAANTQCFSAVATNAGAVAMVVPATPGGLYVPNYLGHYVITYKSPVTTAFVDIVGDGEVTLPAIFRLLYNGRIIASLLSNDVVGQQFFVRGRFALKAPGNIEFNQVEVETSGVGAPTCIAAVGSLCDEVDDDDDDDSRKRSHHHDDDDDDDNSFGPQAPPTVTEGVNGETIGSAQQPFGELCGVDFDTFDEGIASAQVPSRFVDSGFKSIAYEGVFDAVPVMFDDTTVPVGSTLFCARSDNAGAIVQNQALPSAADVAPLGTNSGYVMQLEKAVSMVLIEIVTADAMALAELTITVANSKDGGEQTAKITPAATMLSRTVLTVTTTDGSEFDEVAISSMAGGEALCIQALAVACTELESDDDDE